MFHDIPRIYIQDWILDFWEIDQSIFRKFKIGLPKPRSFSWSTLNVQNGGFHFNISRYIGKKLSTPRILGATTRSSKL